MRAQNKWLLRVKSRMVKSFLLLSLMINNIFNYNSHKNSTGSGIIVKELFYFSAQSYFACNSRMTNRLIL